MTPTTHDIASFILSTLWDERHYLVTALGMVATWLLPSPFLKGRIPMEFLSKLPLFNLASSFIQSAQDVNGPVHGLIKTLANTFGNETEKRLANDDVLYNRLCSFIWDGAALVAEIEKDVA